MIKLSKRQVKGILDTLKQQRQFRPALSTMRLRNGYLYLTDGYILIRMSIEDTHTDLEIPYNKLERWYKLAGTSDKLDEIMLIDPTLCNSENEYQYPEIEKLYELKEDGAKKDELVFDTEKLDRISRILGTNQVKITRYTDRYEVKPCDPKINGTAILMGIN